MGMNVWKKCGTVRNMLNDITPPTGAVTGNWVYKDSPDSTYQAVANGTGAITATITIQYSNDGVNPVATVAGTINLTGTTVASDGFAATGVPWKYHRAVVSAPTGTIASIFVYHGV